MKYLLFIQRKFFLFFDFFLSIVMTFFRFFFIFPRPIWEISFFEVLDFGCGGACGEEASAAMVLLNPTIVFTFSYL